MAKNRPWSQLLRSVESVVVDTEEEAVAVVLASCYNCGGMGHMAMEERYVQKTHTQLQLHFDCN
ncbi:hypothetical protein HN51_047334, partial [Arachis hypogaea]